MTEARKTRKKIRGKMRDVYTITHENSKAARSHKAKVKKSGATVETEKLPDGRTKLTYWW